MYVCDKWEKSTSGHSRYTNERCHILLIHNSSTAAFILAHSIQAVGDYDRQRRPRHLQCEPHCKLRMRRFSFSTADRKYWKCWHLARWIHFEGGKPIVAGILSKFCTSTTESAGFSLNPSRHIHAFGGEWERTDVWGYNICFFAWVAILGRGRIITSLPNSTSPS